jgi:hypothetical protein
MIFENTLFTAVATLLTPATQTSAMLACLLLMPQANDLTGKVQPGNMPFRTFPLRAEVLGAL